MWEALGEYHGPPSVKAFVRYVVARAFRHLEERSYRTYVTNSLRLAPQMMYIPRRWSEITDFSRPGSPEKTAEEIVEGVISKLGEVDE